MTIKKIEDILSQHQHCSLGHFPTPFEYLANLSRDLDGPQIWIKRDDCSGLASGGNKTRKLEYVLGQAMSLGADTILTTGGIQSNHARQTAAACAKLRLKCILLLASPPNWASDIYCRSGNILLDQLFGAEVRIMQEGATPDDELADCANALKAEGSQPFIIPLGASTAIGALGYVGCALELSMQAKTHNIKISHVISAAGSGATQAGLMAGFFALGENIICEGIDIDAERDRTEQRTQKLLQDVMPLINEGLSTLPPVIVREGFAGQGYGVISDMAQDAIKRLAISEGIILDSAYTGKAMSALIDDVEKGRYCKNDTVVFLHTGSFPLTFAYG